MWPMLLNMTRDDCRRTLRRLELEAYSNIISVFRAQGSLEENRKKMLEEIRGVLHISNDRHSAEARRVANDELLATIAEQLAGPNTGLGWINEGRRRVPLLPRGIPQTAYTEIADNAAFEAAAEHKEAQKKLEKEKAVAQTEGTEEVESETAESAISTNTILDEMLYPPIAMEDQTNKLWETELISRKRKVPESGTLPEDSAITPVKNIKNTIGNNNQKHLNLSQIYSNYSKTAASKSSGQSKHSYNQVSKVSTKSNQNHASPTGTTKHRQKRSSKNASQIIISKSQTKKSQDLQGTPIKPYNPTSLHLDYSGPPNTFQASYAQSLLGHPKVNYVDDTTPNISPQPDIESPAMQLLTQPATVPNELGVADATHFEDPTSLQAQATPSSKLLSGKSCHLIIKKKGDASNDKKIQMSEIKILQNPTENIKVLSNRPIVLGPNSAQKTLGTPGKLTKIIHHVPKSQAQLSTPNVVSGEKMIVVTKSDHKPVVNSKNIIVSSSVVSPTNLDSITVNNNNKSPKPIEPAAPKGDLKLSTKTILLHPKSGQKMVVLPAKNAAKTTVEGQTIPLLHFKGIPTTMKLVPVSSHSSSQVAKPTVVSVMPRATTIDTVTTPVTKLTSAEPIKTANMADVLPIKGLHALTGTPKSVVRPSSNKGSVIVVQKGTTLGKTLCFTKNGNDVSKIIMGKNVNQLLQASASHKDDQANIKGSGNVIVLELNNDQTGCTSTMSEILDSHVTKTTRLLDDKKMSNQITEDTPVLFDNQITEDTCNASSLDSTSESIGDIGPIVEAEMCVIDKGEVCKFGKDSECTKDTSSSVTDWEIELDSVSRKDKDDDKLNSLHLDIDMSSDSEDEYMVERHKSKNKHSPQESIQEETPRGERGDLYGVTTGLSQAGRILLSQLQDEGSSSNDSSFALNKPKHITDKLKNVATSKCELGLEKTDSDELSKVKEKLSEKVAEAKSQQKRIDIYSTAISTSDINLDSFSYLEEGMMAGDEMFTHETESKHTARETIKEQTNLDMQINQLLDVSASSSDTKNVCESKP